MSLSLLSGCAHLRKNGADSEETALQTAASPRKGAKPFAPLPVVVTGGTTTQVNDKGEIFVHGVKLENTQYDFPVTINSRVEYWIDYFTGKGRGHFSRYLERSELFIPYIQPILRQYGMPEDLVYLAMIESGFHNLARSTAKAVGPWQFMPATGRRYGLMVNWWIDERRDTHKSTLAAIAYLRDLYTIMGSWELAAASYNAGESKVARGLRRYATKDFWVLSKHQFLRPETRDYVPKIIAAAIVAKNRVQFGFSAAGMHPHKGEAVSGDGEVVKLEKNDPPQEPVAVAVTDEETETVASVIDEVAENTSENPEEAVTAAVLLTQARSDVDPLAKPVTTPSVNKKGELTGEQLVEFELKSPADLLKVARAAGLSYHTVKALNPEILRWVTPPNLATYRVKLPESVKNEFLTNYNSPAFPRQVEFLAYKVRKGETPARVASRFGIKAEPVQDLNGISANRPLRHGSQVLLPMPSDRSRTLASLDVIDPPERRRRSVRRKRARSARHYKVTYDKREAAKSSRRPQSTSKKKNGS